MESEDFMEMVELCVCVLRNIRGMMEMPPELNEAVSMHLKYTSHYSRVLILARKNFGGKKSSGTTQHFSVGKVHAEGKISTKQNQNR